MGGESAGGFLFFADSVPQGLEALTYFKTYAALKAPLFHGGASIRGMSDSSTSRSIALKASANSGQAPHGPV